MIDISKVADKADVIINGYAFTAEDKIIRVLNLNNPEKSAVIDGSGMVTETSMDDIELDIVMEYYSRGKGYMEG